MRKKNTFLLDIAGTFGWDEVFLWLLILGMVSIGAACHSSSQADTTPETLRREQVNSLPPLMLWAWERPEHLEFADPKTVGVAFLAQTAYLRGDEVLVRPRLQPLTLPAGMVRIAVTRVVIEHNTSQLIPPTLTEAQRERIAEVIAKTAALPEVTAVQIDFDAQQSERDFYRGLLTATRARLPATMPLLMTALASWCLRDNWLDSLPVEAAVPMIFRMGIPTANVRQLLADGGRFSSQKCRNSVGLATDEPVAAPALSVRQIYLFNPQAWTAENLTAARQLHEGIRYVY